MNGLKSESPWWKVVAIALGILWLFASGYAIANGDFRWPSEKGDREEKGLRIVNGVAVVGWSDAELAAFARARAADRVAAAMEALPDDEFEAAMKDFAAQLDEFNAKVSTELAAGAVKPDRARALSQRAVRFESKWNMYESERKRRLEQAELVAMEKVVDQNSRSDQ